MKKLMICLLLLAMHGVAMGQSRNIPTKKIENRSSVDLPTLDADAELQRSLPAGTDATAEQTNLENLYKRKLSVVTNLKKDGNDKYRKIGLEEKGEMSVFLVTLIMANAQRKDAVEEFKVEMDEVDADTDVELEAEIAKIRETKAEGLANANALDDLALRTYHHSTSYRSAYSPLLDRKYQRIRNQLVEKTGSVRPAWGRCKSRLTELYFTNTIGKSSFQTLNNSSISIGPQGGYSAYSELITDYLLVGKMSLSTQISNLPEDNDSSAAALAQDNALENLVGGGGNVSLAYTIPVFYLHGGELFHFGASATLPRVGLNLPGIKNVDESPSVVTEIGFESYMMLTGLNRNFGVFGFYSYGLVTGSYNYRKIIGEDFIHLHQMAIGFTINETYRIAANFYMGNDFVRDNFPAQMLSLTIIPDF